ncbi:DUF3391 domain-containing protein [Halomonas organivorans]
MKQEQGIRMINDNIPVYRNLIHIPVSALQVGMYVAELDRPWLETPFALEGVFIRNQADIDSIKQYAHTVYISIDESSSNLFQPVAAPQLKPKKERATQNVGTSYEPLTVRTPIETEIRKVNKEYRGAKRMIKNLMHDSQSWHKNLPDARQAVKSFAQCQRQ